MAIGGLLGNVGPRDYSTEIGKPLTPAQKPEPGSLIIADTFQGTTTDEPHGVIVNRAAMQQGFKGQVYTQASPSYLDPRYAPLSLQVVSGQEGSKERVISVIRKDAARQATQLLQLETNNLNDASKTGAKQTVVNMSSGVSKASIAGRLYSEASCAWTKSSPYLEQSAKLKIKDYAMAFNLDASKLQSSDPKVNGPERAKLQQALVDQVSQGMDGSPEVAGAKKSFLAAVKGFESKHNSVVISAGNEGDVLTNFKKDNGGRNLRLPKDFDENVLQNSEVTSVGATRWYGAEQLRETRANYSSKNGGVDVYASGSVAGTKDANKAENFGTSFAAPRVAAAMAQLHKDNPSMSSAQVEALLKKNLTHSLATPQGQLEVLDFGKTASYLANNTF